MAKPKYGPLDTRIFVKIDQYGFTTTVPYKMVRPLIEENILERALFTRIKKAFETKYPRNNFPEPIFFGENKNCIVKIIQRFSFKMVKTSATIAELPPVFCSKKTKKRKSKYDPIEGQMQLFPLKL